MNKQNLYEKLNIFYFPNHEDAIFFYKEALENHRKNSYKNENIYNQFFDQINETPNKREVVLTKLRKLVESEETKLQDMKQAYEILSNKKFKEEYDDNHASTIGKSLKNKVLSVFNEFIELNNNYFNYDQEIVNKVIDNEINLLKNFYDLYITSFEMRLRENKSYRDYNFLLNLIDSIEIDTINWEKNFNTQSLIYESELKAMRYAIKVSVARFITFILLYYEQISSIDKFYHWLIKELKDKQYNYEPDHKQKYIK